MTQESSHAHDLLGVTVAHVVPALSILTPSHAWLKSTVGRSHDIDGDGRDGNAEHDQQKCDELHGHGCGDLRIVLVRGWWMCDGQVVEKAVMKKSKDRIRV